LTEESSVYSDSTFTKVCERLLTSIRRFCAMSLLIHE
jgi:hypothetical protein